MQLNETAGERAMRKGYEEFDVVDCSDDCKSEAGKLKILTL
jgi:hypothetical protein